MKAIEKMSAKELYSMSETIKKSEDILIRIRLCEGCKVLAGTQLYYKDPSSFETALKIYESVENELITTTKQISFTLLKVACPDLKKSYSELLSSLGIKKLFDHDNNFNNFNLQWKEAVKVALRDMNSNFVEISKLDIARIVIGFDAQFSPNQVPVETIIRAINMFPLIYKPSNRQAVQNLLSTYINFEQENIDTALADCVMD